MQKVDKIHVKPLNSQRGSKISPANAEKYSIWAVKGSIRTLCSMEFRLLGLIVNRWRWEFHYQKRKWTAWWLRQSSSSS